MSDEEFEENFNGFYNSIDEIDDIEDTEVLKLKGTIDKIKPSKVCSHRNKKLICSNDDSSKIHKYCNDCGKILSTKYIKCLHLDSFKDENGLYVCRSCYQEIEILDSEPEWRNYGSSGDSSRCNFPIDECKSIKETLINENITVHDAVLKQIVFYYKTIVRNGTKNETYRGNNRKGIIAACLFHSYIEYGEYRTIDHIRNMFGINKKTMTKGIRQFALSFPDLKNKYIQPEDLVKWIMKLTGIGDEHYKAIMTLTKYFRNSSETLKRSSPQSVASAIIYFYLCLYKDYRKQLGLTKNKFAEKAQLSDITITKLAREAAVIANCNIQI